MDKKKLMWLVSGAALAIVVVSALCLSSPSVLNDNGGSSSNNGTAGPSDDRPRPQWRPGYENGRPQMNMSEEERRQMMEERMQVATAACQGKTEGDACTMQGPGGDMNGTCKTQNEKMACRPEMPMRGNNEWQVKGPT